MLEWYLPDRGAEPTSHAARRIRRDVARSAGQGRRRAQNLGAAGLPFPQSDLARRTGRHCESRHHRFPGCRAGPGRLRSGIAAAGCADRCARAARTGAADALHQGAARRRRRRSIRPPSPSSMRIMSAQRNTRLLGTFARLNRRDGKPQYLRHQPRIWTYLNRSLAHPALSHFGTGTPPTCRRRPGNLPLVSQPPLNLQQTLPLRGVGGCLSGRSKSW